MMESSKQTFFEAVGRGAVGEVRSMVTVNGRELMVQFARSSNDFGETPLILAVKGNHEEMVKLLVEELDAPLGQTGRFVWKGIDYQAVPPLFSAILAEHTDHLPILKFLIDKDLTANNSFAGLDSIMSNSVPLTQKIDILELMGAAYILENRFDFAMKCWVRAVALRQSTEEFEPFPQDLDERFQRLMGNAQEIRSMEQLEEFAVSLHEVPWNTQALLVSRRILNRLNPGISCFFLRLCIQRCNFCVGPRQYTHMFDVSIFVAELLDSLPLENLNNCRLVTFNAFVWMSWALKLMFERPLSDPEQIGPLTENLLRNIRLASVLIYKHQRLRLEGRLTPDRTPPADVADAAGLHGPAYVSALLAARGFTGSIFDMLRITTFMSMHLWELVRKEANRLQVKQQLFQYSRFIKENPGVVSLLHLAVIFQDVDVIQLLLETGADPNAVDVYGNTPLHLLTFRYRREDRRAVTQLLLDAGCHFDQVNVNGETALSLSKKPRGAQVHPFVEIVPSLFCCCAQVIAKHKIPFKHEEIPTAVQSDVELHVAKGPQSSWYSDYFKLQLP